jgi:hypothetical protein
MFRGRFFFTFAPATLTPMAFGNPAFLFFLFALVIPVLIHLFNFRQYKKVWFTNVRFLSEIKQETKKRSQLKQLLILLSRLLALAALIIAFAQPYTPSPTRKFTQSGKQEVTVYLDNSFSMEALTPNGPLIDIARIRAKEIAGSFKSSDLFRLITNDFDGKHQRYVSRDEFNSMVDEVTISPVSRKLSEVLVRESEQPAGSSGINQEVFLVSDFQKSTADFMNIRPDTSVHYFFVQLVPNKSNNLFIDSVWFESPVQQPLQQSRLRVRLQNHGTEDLAKIPVKLTLNGKQKAVASTAIPAGSMIELAIPFTNNPGGFQSGSIEVPDYPVTYDDKMFIAYPLVSSIPVLSIGGDKENPYLSALFGDDTTFRYKAVNSKNLDYSAFRSYPLIILDGLPEISSGLAQELQRYIESGGNVVLFPAPEINSGQYADFLRTLGAPPLGKMDTVTRRVDQLQVENPVFNDVFEHSLSGKARLPENTDLPVVFMHYYTNLKEGRLLEPVMQMNNGDLFMGSLPAGKGRLYLFTSPLSGQFTNFPKHIIFVPTMLKIALLSEPTQGLYYPAGGNDPIVMQNDSATNEVIFKIKRDNSDFEIIPEMRNLGFGLQLFPHQQVKEAGIYSLLREKQPVAQVAFNYDRRESDLSLYGSTEIERFLDQSHLVHFSLLQDGKLPLTRQLDQIHQGSQFWKLFLLLALLFIAIEIAIIRFVK